MKYLSHKKILYSTIQYENVHLKGQGDPDVQLPDSWSSLVLQMEPPRKVTLRRLTAPIGIVPHRLPLKLLFIYLFNKYRY